MAVTALLTPALAVANKPDCESVTTSPATTPTSVPLERVATVVPSYVLVATEVPLTVNALGVMEYVDPAKAAADDNKEPSIGTKESTEQVIAATQLREATQAELEQVYKEFNGTNPKTTVYTNVSPSYYKLVQVGWVYARLSEDRLQAVGVWLPKDTQVEVISVQNGISDGYDFVDHKWTTTGTGRAHGHIVINQQGAPR